MDSGSTDNVSNEFPQNANDATEKEDEGGEKLPAKRDQEEERLLSSQASSHLPSDEDSPQEMRKQSTNLAIASPKGSLPEETNRASAARRRTPYHEVRNLMPYYPYFYYRDHSQHLDDVPNTPLSPSLRVPNFVIKLHALLICEGLSDSIHVNQVSLMRYVDIICSDHIYVTFSRLIFKSSFAYTKC